MLSVTRSAFRRAPGNLKHASKTSSGAHGLGDGGHIEHVRGLKIRATEDHFFRQDFIERLKRDVSLSIGIQFVPPIAVQKGSFWGGEIWPVAA